MLSGTAVVLALDAYSATTRYEAESAPALCGGAVASNHSGYSGSGFCDPTNAVGSAVQFTVNVPAAGTATVTIRYANGSTANRPANITVNGTEAQSGFAFEATGGWTTWASKTLTVQLAVGTNTVRLAATTSNGLGNIDYAEVAATGGGGGDGSIMQGADVSVGQRADDLGAKYYDADGTAGRRARHPQERRRELRPAARLEQPAQRLQQQGQGPAVRPRR